MKSKHKATKWANKQVGEIMCGLDLVVKEWQMECIHTYTNVWVWYWCTHHRASRRDK